MTVNISDMEPNDAQLFNPWRRQPVAVFFVDLVYDLVYVNSNHVLQRFGRYGR